MDAIRLAREAGFANVNLDLIFALPEQTLAEWEADLAHRDRARARSRLGLQPDLRGEHARSRRCGAGASCSRWRRRSRWRCSRARARCSPAPATSRTRSRTSRGRAAPAATTSTTGGAATTSASAPARTRSRARRIRARRWSNEKLPARYIERASATGAARVFEETLTQRAGARRVRLPRPALQRRLRRRGLRRPLRRRLSDASSRTPGRSCATAFSNTPTRAGASPRRGLLLADSIFATFA